MAGKMHEDHKLKERNRAMIASLPANESQRLHALHRYEILDTAPEQEFDDITLLAARICGTPMAMISLVDEKRQWFKSRVGMAESELSRDSAFCAEGILQTDLFVLEDTQADPRFAKNPLVTGNSKIRFYAGSPLITPDGHALGMLCVMDRVPRQLNPEQKTALQVLSRQVVALLGLQRNLKELHETIAQRNRAEQKLNLEYAVSRILAKSLSWEKTIREIIQIICELMHWDAGSFWAIDYSPGVLRCGETWCASNTKADEFQNLSRKMTFAPGVGLPGRVWATGQSVWIRDVVQDANFPRAGAAKQAGLFGAFAFPILIENGVGGVVEFFSREIREPDGDLLDTFTIIGNQLGQFFNSKRAEAELKFERNLLYTLMNKTDDFIYFKDSESRFIRTSTSLARLHGLQNPEELIGKHDSDFYVNEFAREALENEQTIMRTGEPMIGKVEKETWPDGHTKWMLSSKWPFHNSQGGIIGTFGISKDITAIKEAEKKLNEVHGQLVDASRQAGMAEVATNVLHNVGNVLNSVNISCSLVADKTQNSKIMDVAQVVELIQAHENDLGNFITNDSRGKQLPDYLAKLTAHLVGEREDILREIGSLVNNIVHIKEIVVMQQNYATASGVVESLSMVDLVEDAIRMNHGAMIRHNVKVVRDFAAVPPILTEKHKVLQILVNLIRNAKYACDDSDRNDKQITLRVAHGSEWVKISVMDNGVGIPAENLARIFNPGFTTRKEGHGFGLHSGALAAKEIGGTLAAFSDGPGHGATFTLELPAQKRK
jgi:PAS domain S-box-containing protein